MICSETHQTRQHPEVYIVIVIITTLSNDTICIAVLLKSELLSKKNTHFRNRRAPLYHKFLGTLNQAAHNWSVVGARLAS